MVVRRPDDVMGDAARWNALADRWFEQADRADLWVTVWATGEWWGTSYQLAAYERSSPSGPVDRPDTQAAVIERHATTPRYLRGIDGAGGEFGAPAVDGTSGFSNANPGGYGQAYHYDQQATFDYLASRGIKVVRIPFRWERLQRRLRAPLDSGELSRLKAVVARAGRAGLEVILDMHNYGGYYLSAGGQGVRRTIGSAECSIPDFADVWRRISEAFRGDPTVIGYGLMNEPAEMASAGSLSPAVVWQRASQAALDAIRASGDHKVIMVAGYFWSSIPQWLKWNPRPWIHDPENNYRYEGHHYWDPDGSGTYGASYASDVADAAARGFG